MPSLFAAIAVLAAIAILFFLSEARRVSEESRRWREFYEGRRSSENDPRR